MCIQHNNDMGILAKLIDQRLTWPSSEKLLVVLGTTQRPATNSVQSERPWGTSLKPPQGSWNPGKEEAEGWKEPVVMGYVMETVPSRRNRTETYELIETVRECTGLSQMGSQDREGEVALGSQH